jgi:hypothetical protein
MLSCEENCQGLEGRGRTTELFAGLWPDLALRQAVVDNEASGAGGRLLELMGQTVGRKYLSTRVCLGTALRNQDCCTCGE